MLFLRSGFYAPASRYHKEELLHTVKERWASCSPASSVEAVSSLARKMGVCSCSCLLISFIWLRAPWQPSSCNLLSCTCIVMYIVDRTLIASQRLPVCYKLQTGHPFTVTGSERLSRSFRYIVFLAKADPFVMDSNRMHKHPKHPGCTLSFALSRQQLDFCGRHPTTSSFRSSLLQATSCGKSVRVTSDVDYTQHVLARLVHVLLVSFTPLAPFYRCSVTISRQSQTRRGKPALAAYPYLFTDAGSRISCVHGRFR